jgi:hypothetical protein
MDKNQTFVSDQVAIDFGLRVRLTDQDERQYSAIFFEKSDLLRKCVFCDVFVREGDFALETLKQEKFPSKPRICCTECAELHAWKFGKTRVVTKHVFSLMKVFHTMNSQVRELNTKSFIEENDSKFNFEHEDRIGNSSFEKKSYKDICTKDDDDLVGFLETLQVITNSSAWNAGLRQGDIFLRFGPFTKFNFSDLEQLWKYVDQMDGKPVECYIGRRLTGSGGVITAPRLRVKKKIVMYPQKWTHGYVLGCVVNSYPPPSPVCD